MEDDLISFGTTADNEYSGGYGNSNGNPYVEQTDGGNFFTDKLYSDNIKLPKIAFYVFLVFMVLSLIFLVAGSALAVKNAETRKGGILGFIFGLIALAPTIFVTYVLFNCKEGNYAAKS